MRACEAREPIYARGAWLALVTHQRDPVVDPLRRSVCRNTRINLRHLRPSCCVRDVLPRTNRARGGTTEEGM